MAAGQIGELGGVVPNHVALEIKLAIANVIIQDHKRVGHPVKVPGLTPSFAQMAPVQVHHSSCDYVFSDTRTL